MSVHEYEREYIDCGRDCDNEGPCPEEHQVRLRIDTARRTAAVQIDDAVLVMPQALFLALAKISNDWMMRQIR